jgi:acetyltransferase-like isoleucine patch superfamily enzyme
MGLVTSWRTWKHGRKFAKVGKGCKFPAKYLEVEGHVELGAHCRFRNNVILRATGNGKIIFGDRTGASYNVIIEATELVRIGTYTGIAEFTVIRDTHHLVIGTDINWRLTPHVTEPVIIGDHVFIGSRCYIMPGVTIGDGAVIHAGSVITKNVGPFEVWAGYPARKIAHRLEGIPESKMKMAQELLGAYGVKQDRYTDALWPDSIKEQRKAEMEQRLQQEQESDKDEA